MTSTKNKKRFDTDLYTEKEIYTGYITCDDVIKTYNHAKELPLTDPVFDIGNKDDKKEGTLRYKEQILSEILKIKEIMERYNLSIYPSHELLSFNVPQRIAKGAKVKPKIYKSLKTGSYRVTTAPKLRKGECCANCAHYISDYGGGNCKLHTNTDMRYDPPMVKPLEPFDSDVCDDYESIPK
jgi:hypothetical protein